LPKLDIAANYAEMNRVAGLFLSTALGPKFTSTPAGHIQTDIAAACSLSGLMILQETVDNLSGLEPGTVLLSDVHPLQKEVFGFMMNVAHSNGLDPSSGWDNLDGIQDPMFECAEMTKRLAPVFYSVSHSFERPYLKFLAALAGMKLVFAGRSTGLLDPDIGKGLAFYYVVAGSKTVPFPEALWPSHPDLA